MIYATVWERFLLANHIYFIGTFGFTVFLMLAIFTQSNEVADSLASELMDPLLGATSADDESLAQPAFPTAVSSMTMAGCLSRIIFSWVTELFQTGYRRQLDEDDLWPLSPNDSTVAAARGLATMLEFEQQQSHPSLLRALRTCFGAHYYWLGILKLITDSLSFSGPLLLKALVEYVSGGSPYSSSVEFG